MRRFPALIAASVFCMALLLHGCRQCWTPDICPPDAFVEGDYMEEIKGEEIPIVDWWAHLGDEKLVSMVERALCCNIALRNARERVNEAKALFGVAFSPLFPSSDLVGSISRSKSSGTFFEGGVPSFSNNYDLGISGFWNFDLWGRNLDEARAAWLDVCAATEDLRNVHVQTAADVATTYVNVRAFQQRVKVAEETIEQENELVEITKMRLEAGMISFLDYAEAELLLRLRQNNLLDFKQILKQTVYQLAFLLSVNPEELAYLFDDIGPIPISKGKIPIGIPGELLCRRGDIRQAEMSMRAAGARVMVARKELLPTINISGLFNYVTGFYRKWFDQFSQAWNLSPSFTFPLFQGGRIFSNIDAVTSFQRQRVLDYQNSVLAALQELETALVAHFYQLQQNDLKIKRVEAGQQSYQLALDRYLSGLIDFLNVSINSRELFDARQALIDTEESLMTSFINIYRALGGGWEPPPKACP